MFATFFLLFNGDYQIKGIFLIFYGFITMVIREGMGIITLTAQNSRRGRLTHIGAITTHVEMSHRDK